MTKMELESSNKIFEGEQRVYTHTSSAVAGNMRFAVFLPKKALEGGACSTLYFLSGLTCTEQNVVTKGGFQSHAAAHDFIVVCPDTSPRGSEVPDDEAYDLGQGAGFYLNATQAPWSEHFQMQRYVAEELPTLIDAEFPTSGRTGITGHSMGGHGALTLFFKYPERYGSVSALSPIVAPTAVPWGQKAFSAYLGSQDSKAWQEHDACRLVADYAGERAPILVDQGDADAFLDEQLRPELFEEACRAAGHPLTLRRHRGYDHSYYFIATFLPDHIAHHARALS